MTVSAPHSATYTVTGMTCEHCVASVTEELTALADVTGVHVDLSTGAVTVSSKRPLTIQEVTGAVTEAGYQLAD
ncbi:MAG TPA: heavy metal-associated domain-containing protein [Pseudonocardiaceae bacterium]|nr:heavy metal-associated domain-containing protein [Pseudonocardiaceae bacterium]